MGNAMAGNASVAMLHNHNDNHTNSSIPFNNILTTSGVGHMPLGISLSGVGVGIPSDSLPRIDIVSLSMRRDIVAGKDINLAALLIPGYTADDQLARHLVRMRLYL
jgi:hypothetical protein